jgi:hypothetical protein
MSTFEMSHPVEEYRFYDWNVWPLLRVIIGYPALEYHQKQDGPVNPAVMEPTRKFDAKKLIQRIPLVGHAALSVWRMQKILKRRKMLQRLLELDPKHNDDVLATGREIVVLTLSGRRQKLDSGLYEIYADPLVECFTEMGIPILVWERFEERWPRCHPSAWITRQLELDLLETPELPELVEPGWFNDFALLAESLTGRRYQWLEIEVPIRSLQRTSLVFESWLRQTGVKILISVCWYDAEVMAATLAARRLGVTSVDLQHGTQGVGHFAYDGWLKAPLSDFEIVPDKFWSWGEGQAKRLMHENPAFAQQRNAFVGGNLWLNKCRNKDIAFSDARFDTLKREINNHMLTILVTLQHGYQYNELITTAISNSPEEWFWLVRLHPATSEKEISHVKNLLNAFSTSKVEYVVASEAPLLLLIGISNVHITGSSTCALEALGFGLPSIIVNEDGFIAYKKYIDAGVMLFAKNAEDVVSMITLSQGIDKDLCQQTSDDIFASQEEAHKNISKFLTDHNIRLRQTKECYIRPDECQIVIG